MLRGPLLLRILLCFGNRNGFGLRRKPGIQPQVENADKNVLGQRFCFFRCGCSRFVIQS